MTCEIRGARPVALRGMALVSLLLVSACTTQRTPPPPVPAPAPAPTPTPIPTPPPPANAATAGFRVVAPKPLTEPVAARALTAFRVSCGPIVNGRRVDSSGLTDLSLWQPVCARAATVVPGTAEAFFRDELDWLEVGDGVAFATGYYEPEISGVRIRQPGFDVPVYATPVSMVRCTRVDGTNGRGRLDFSGQCVVFFTRTEIEDGALASEQPIAWVADPIDLFFLQVQGSGRLRGPDGSIVRIGYAEQNGHSYVAIGRVLRERNVLPPGGATMAGIVGWMRAQPDRGKALMRENPSYIFFRELTGAGPLGAMGVPVATNASVAADPKFIPLGAPVWIDMDRDIADGLWVAQDTGGAIKGANRVDTFWGAGASAESIAGGMSATGRGLVLIPKGTSVARAQR
ncbi:MAG: MltA domain-containing protein [Sphingomicrobium sp.]